MTNSRYMCCKMCFDDISEKNPNAAELWLHLCAIFTRVRGVFAIKEIDCKELKVLERNGYLVSTEDVDYIAININGHVIDQYETDVFCINKGDHWIYE